MHISDSPLLNGGIMPAPDINCIVCGRVPEDKEIFNETEDGFICPECSGDFDEPSTSNCNDTLDCDLQNDQEEPLDY